jgi:hypothetical protein
MVLTRKNTIEDGFFLEANSKSVTLFERLGSKVNEVECLCSGDPKELKKWIDAKTVEYPGIKLIGQERIIRMFSEAKRKEEAK